MIFSEPITSDRDRPRARSRLAELRDDPELARRFDRIRALSRQVRSSEYHLTNACNLRCEGCWFFNYEFDQQGRERTQLEDWQTFAEQEVARGVTAALLIGGEPTLYLDRVRVFVDAMPYVTISSNGLKALPRRGFENVNVALTLFGGVDADDRMRAIKPNGDRFRGLLDQVLRNYKDDERAIFIYALDSDSVEQLEATVSRIEANGNVVSFNYYSAYGSTEAPADRREEDLLSEALRVAEAYPGTVLSHPYYIRALLTGKTNWGAFSYESCPSISVDHPAHADRLKNLNPVLPGFNAYAADGSVSFCCTSGHCESCRDSQAVQSWLLSSVRQFMRQPGGIRTWVELAETYWGQFVWSEFHPSRRAARR